MPGRFATYKRAHLLFRDLDRLARIVNNPERPVQFVFAGKAHPRDIPGQDLIKMIVEISKRPEFIGKIVFLQNYDIMLAKRLVRGVDIWLNTPTRPLEASGTSGEKAVMNGTMHFSVLDGWWAEGYREDAGWALPIERSFDNQELQDELDAERIYTLLENDITEKFYNRNDAGYPGGLGGYDPFHHCPCGTRVYHEPDDQGLYRPVLYEAIRENPETERKGLPGSQRAGTLEAPDPGALERASGWWSMISRM